MSSASPIRLEAERIGIVPKDCPDCQGNSVVHMLGEEWPCPSCCSVAYNEQLRERRIDDGSHGSGA